MNRPLFQPGEEVVIHQPSDPFHGQEFVVTEFCYFNEDEIHGIHTFTQEGWWYKTPDFFEWISEKSLRKKYDGAGDFDQMLEDLNLPFDETRQRQFIMEGMRERVGMNP